MGLAITAFSRAIRDHTVDDYCEDESHVRAFVPDRFTHALGGLESGRCYDIRGGESFRFQAGSYTGYNEWRRRLSLVMLGVEPEDMWHQPEMWQESPFYELIDFSDCEGVIGPAVAVKLSADFSEHAQRFLEATADDVDPWDQRKYEEWHRAFALAARGGLVRFS